MKRIAYLRAAVTLAACLGNPDKAETLAVAAPGALPLYGVLSYLARRSLSALDAEWAETFRVRRERIAREKQIQEYLTRGDA